jgi:hypothetical protein
MKEQKINPVYLGITIVGVIGLTVWLIVAQHHLSRFVPTPPPAAMQQVNPISEDSSIPSAATAPASSAQTTDPSVCYASDAASFKVTVDSGNMATAEVRTPTSGNTAMTLNGTLAIDTANSGGYVFTSPQETVQFDSTHAQIGNGSSVVSVPRVDCGN